MLACVKGGLLVPMPINRTTLNLMYGVNLQTDADAEAFLESRAEPVEKIRTSEDVVISKLEWGKLGQSHRQVEDVAALIQVCERLDRAYLDKWIKALGLEGEWRAALALAKPKRS